MHLAEQRCQTVLSAHGWCRHRHRAVGALTWRCAQQAQQEAFSVAFTLQARQGSGGLYNASQQLLEVAEVSDQLGAPQLPSPGMHLLCAAADAAGAS